MLIVREKGRGAFASEFPGMVPKKQEGIEKLQQIL